MLFGRGGARRYNLRKPPVGRRGSPGYRRRPITGRGPPSAATRGGRLRWGAAGLPRFHPPRHAISRTHDVIRRPGPRAPLPHRGRHRSDAPHGSGSPRARSGGRARRAARRPARRAARVLLRVSGPLHAMGHRICQSPDRDRRVGGGREWSAPSTGEARCCSTRSGRPSKASRTWRGSDAGTPPSNSRCASRSPASPRKTGAASRPSSRRSAPLPPDSRPRTTPTSAFMARSAMTWRSSSTRSGASGPVPATAPG